MRLLRALRLAVVLVVLRRDGEHPITVTGYYRRYRRWSLIRARYRLRWLRERARANRLERLVESTIATMRAAPPDLGNTSFGER